MRQKTKSNMRAGSTLQKICIVSTSQESNVQSIIIIVAKTQYRELYISNPCLPLQVYLPKIWHLDKIKAVSILASRNMLPLIIVIFFLFYP